MSLPAHRSPFLFQLRHHQLAYNPQNMPPEEDRGWLLSLMHPQMRSTPRREVPPDQLHRNHGRPREENLLPSPLFLDQCWPRGSLCRLHIRRLPVTPGKAGPMPQAMAFHPSEEVERRGKCATCNVSEGIQTHFLTACGALGFFFFFLKDLRIF